MLQYFETRGNNKEAILQLTLIDFGKANTINHIVILGLQIKPLQLILAHIQYCVHLQSSRDQNEATIQKNYEVRSYGNTCVDNVMGQTLKYIRQFMVLMYMVFT